MTSEEAQITHLATELDALTTLFKFLESKIIHLQAQMIEMPTKIEKAIKVEVQNVLNDLLMETIEEAVKNRFAAQFFDTSNAMHLTPLKSHEPRNKNAKVIPLHQTANKEEAWKPTL